MQRIESNVATQFADISRPRQSNLDSVAQVEEARSRDQSAEGLSARSISAEDLGSTLAQMQKVVQAATGRALTFEVDEDRKDLIVTVKDSDGEIIRQIPPEEVLELRKRLDDFVGVFMDDLA